LNANVIISCAVTGAGDTVGKHPAIPVTPRQIADSALEAHAAGAAIVHLHVRDPRSGKAARDPELYRETGNAGYLELASAQPARVRVVDATGTAHSVTGHALEAIADLLPAAAA